MCGVVAFLCQEPNHPKKYNTCDPAKLGYEVKISKTIYTCLFFVTGKNIQIIFQVFPKYLKILDKLQEQRDRCEINASEISNAAE